MRIYCSSGNIMTKITEEKTVVEAVKRNSCDALFGELRRYFSDKLYSEIEKILKKCANCSKFTGFCTLIANFFFTVYEIMA